MNILIASNSFKHSLRATEITNTIEKAFKVVNENWEIIKKTLNENGEVIEEGDLNTIEGNQHQVEVLDPLGRKIKASFSVTEDKTAMIELAEASGLKLLKPSELDPMKASTFGVGQLIKAAMDLECQEIFVNLEGCAAVDGGIGMLQALGVQLNNKNVVEVGKGGEALMQIDKIDVSNLDTRIKDTKIVAYCEVENPLLGYNGAAPAFALQKGANPFQIKMLEHGLRNLSNKVKESLKKDITMMKYGGAAGGTAGVMYAFLNATLTSENTFASDSIDLVEALEQSDLVITNTGLEEIALKAKELDKTVIGFGEIATNLEIFDGAFSIANGSMTLEKMRSNTENLLYEKALQVAKLIDKLSA